MNSPRSRPRNRGGAVEKRMTQAQWWLLGAVMLGLAIFIYLVFFCPTECH